MRRPDPEPPVTPPEVRRVPTYCPMCGHEATELYLDKYHDVFACQDCVKHDLIDDLLDIPENAPIPECRWCGEREQSVYMTETGEIRACWKCLTIRQV